MLWFLLGMSRYEAVWRHCFLLVFVFLGFVLRVLGEMVWCCYLLVEGFVEGTRLLSVV